MRASRQMQTADLQLIGAEVIFIGGPFMSDGRVNRTKVGSITTPRMLSQMQRMLSQMQLYLCHAKRLVT